MAALLIVSILVLLVLLGYEFAMLLLAHVSSDEAKAPRRQLRTGEWPSV